MSCHDYNGFAVAKEVKKGVSAPFFVDRKGMITNADYVHLHNHSAYSRFDGLAQLDSMTLTAKLLGFRALAITDHGNLGGWIKFYQSCSPKKKKYKIDYLTDRSLLNNTNIKYVIHKDKETNRETEIELIDPGPLKPILGCEFYLSRNLREKNVDGRKGNRHLLLLAKNRTGYQNICKLSEISWLEGQFHDPRVDLETLAQYSDGIIASSACLSSIVNNNLLYGRYEQAKKAATILKDIFDKDFYLSTMYHGIEEEAAIIPDQIKLAKELGVLLVAENDAHMCTRNQATSQEVLMAMSSSRCIKDPKAYHYPYPELYLKSAAEMEKIYGSYPEILRNTVEIAERISDPIQVGAMILPNFVVENEIKTDQTLPNVLYGKNDNEFEKSFTMLVKLCLIGMKKKGWDKSQKHIDRLTTELNYIRVAWESKGMNFPNYFLIEWDAINFATENNILVGYGRGSGYGCLILHCLGICRGNIDPIEKGLLFERFLGFDKVIYLTDKDWGFDEIEDSTIEIDHEVEEIDTDDVDIEDDESGISRY